MKTTAPLLATATLLALAGCSGVSIPRENVPLSTATDEASMRTFCDEVFGDPGDIATDLLGIAGGDYRWAARVDSVEDLGRTRTTRRCYATTSTIDETQFVFTINPSPLDPDDEPAARVGMDMHLSYSGTGKNSTLAKPQKDALQDYFNEVAPHIEP